ncbi:MAG: aspartyl protease family protein [Terriglobales bacterium]
MFSGLLGLFCTLCIAQSIPNAPTILTGNQAQTPAPAPTQSSSVLAWSLYCNGDFAGASGQYQQMLKENPKSADAYAGLTHVYLKQKNVDLASQTVAEGLALSNSPSLHVALGEVEFRQGKISEAEQEWVKVINSGHLDPRAFLGLARVSDAVAMYKRGKAMIDKAHELDPTDPDIERQWIRTMPRRRQIENLEEYLSGPNDENPEQRARINRYLEYLRVRSQGANASCRMVSNVKATETPLLRLLRDADHLRGYGLAVKVNDRKSTLMLDTGASGILLDRGVAEKAGITKLTETSIGGIGDKGLRGGYFGIAKTISVGGLEFQNCPVEVLENRSVVGDEGLIGADVFEDFLVDIDFQNEKLRISALPKRPEDAARPPGLYSEDDEDSDTPEEQTGNAATAGTAEKSISPPKPRFHDAYIAPEMKSYTRVFRFGHYLLIPTYVGNSPSKLFLIDSGSYGNEITPAAAREVTKVRGDAFMHVTGISGRVNKVYSADDAVIRVGHLRQENEYIVAFDLTSTSESAGMEVSGILGFAMLRLLDVKIDYRDALVDLYHDPSPRQTLK